MKIVELGYVFLPVKGGEEHYVEVVSKLFENEGYKVVFIQRGFKNLFTKQEAVRYSKNITSVGVRFLAPNDPNGPVLDRQPLYNILSMWKLFKIAKSGDIVITHYPQLFWPGCWLLKKFKNVKVVCISHGITWDGKQTWKEKLFYGMIIWLNKRAVNGADLIVPDDTRYVAEMKKWNSKTLNKVRVVINFVDTDFYTPGDRREKIVYCPRNLRYARGIDLAIDAMKVVNEYDKNIKLIITGDGPIKQELEQRIKKLKINAEILPRIDDKKKLRALYQKAAAVIVPSRFSEGTSFAALEAMACATPVVTTNLGGLPDIVRDKDNGYVRNPDATQLGEALVAIFKNKKDAQRMGKRGRERAEKEFSYPTFKKKWINILKEVRQ